MFVVRYPLIYSILLLFLILANICCIAAPGNYSFEYHVQGRQIILTPTIDNTAYTYYKWSIHSNDNQFSDTDWININDIDTHVSTVDYNKTYVIKLFVRTCTGSMYSTGQTIQVTTHIGSNDPYYKEKDTSEPATASDNGYLLGGLISFLLGLHWFLQLILVLFIILLFILLLYQKKKTIIYFIKKR